MSERSGSSNRFDLAVDIAANREEVGRCNAILDRALLDLGVVHATVLRRRTMCAFLTKVVGNCAARMAIDVTLDADGLDGYASPRARCWPGWSPPCHTTPLKPTRCPSSRARTGMAARRGLLFATTGQPSSSISSRPSARRITRPKAAVGPVAA